MHIGFTGTQDGMVPWQKEALESYLRQALHGYPPSEAHFFHHGDCVGADAEAHEIAHALGFRVIIHPPKVSTKRAFCVLWSGDQYRPVADYLARNRCIVNECRTLIAAPKASQEELRSGTWATVRYARKAKKNIVILLPEYEIKWEALDHA